MCARALEASKGRPPSSAVPFSGVPFFYGGGHLSSVHGSDTATISVWRRGPPWGILVGFLLLMSGTCDGRLVWCKYFLLIVDCCFGLVKCIGPCRTEIFTCTGACAWLVSCRNYYLASISPRRGLCCSSAAVVANI